MTENAEENARLAGDHAVAIPPVLDLPHSTPKTSVRRDQTRGLPFIHHVIG